MNAKVNDRMGTPNVNIITCEEYERFYFLENIFDEVSVAERNEKSA